MIKGKKILIRVDGSHLIGLGHIYRMNSLSSFLKQKGSNVSFLTLEDNISNNLLKKTGLPCFIFQHNSYNSILKRAIKQCQPDLIIQDILETSIESLKNLQKNTSAKIVNFDDINAGLLIADAVINGMVFHWNKYKTKEIRTNLYEGTKYMVLQPELNKYINLEKTISKKAKNILIVIGGTDTHYVTERVLESINEINDLLNVKINIGPGAKTTYNFYQLKKASKHHIDIIQFSPNLFKECYQADLVICGGGTMLYELAAIGIPSASIATESHEILNINYWAKIGSTVSLGGEKDMKIRQISDIVERLLNNKKKLLQMSKVGKKVIDEKGIFRVFNILEEIIN